MAQRSTSHSELRRSEHLRFLEQIECIPLTDSCCEICHCDCYSTHRSSEYVEDDVDTKVLLQLPAKTSSRDSTIADSNNNKQSPEKSHAKPKKASTKKKKSAAAANIDVLEKTATSKMSSKVSSKNAKSNATNNKLPVELNKSSSCNHPKRQSRSKSASSMRSQPSSTYASIHNMRDCQIMQELLTSLEDTPAATELPRLVVRGKSKKCHSMAKSSWPSALNAYQHKENETEDEKDEEAPLKLCESMANLCLSPRVRQAYQQVPAHDKLIINRMATKRAAGVAAKENAWLARKYWENERYERELLKCEEMDEYKRAVRDKQFQDYLQTKARLQEMAQRDMAALQQLRDSLKQKDRRARQRLDVVRAERGIMQCQRRCDELRKCEAVNQQQEEHQLDEHLRKQQHCQRLSERLERAEQARSQLLEGYLKRVRYDNYIEQLLHEEKWRERQQCERAKREQLQQHISRKRNKSQRFVENRHQRNATLKRTAKLAASLRELVRTSVTPESALGNTASYNGAMQLSLGRLLFDRPHSKMSMQ